ncbi:PucR family transcriptional regulator [Nocardioides sp. MAH-18]|uniref:PucR family transcriptional regulator n=1 Tax=Nocardioides agri TaxID=2682843 RepID=A0A6L6XKW6_9ACTN|nr:MULTISPECIES: helix-turn-helix domain-containing protein [unclassified Nocardioides]MBA2956433.1 helix-turn-helix domain-containing protein [Nocardioides sp. CGMCC 1.13656]MVQ47582.1 PucR family transcriptional regulator [Nocardioides sp. MAH-18]
MTVVPNPRPRASLGRVLDDLGATLLDLVQGDAESAEEIGGVVIHDPVDLPVLPPHALVLGVGVDGPEALVALLKELGAARAAGLVVRAPVPATSDVRAAVDASGVALLGLSRGAPWAHLAAMLRSLLAEGDVGVAGPESLGGLPSGDLFAVANAIASLLDAPITIEDRSSRVLAFSGGQDEADPSRVETILGRQVPERYSRYLTERGVFRELHRSDRPVFISPVPDGDDAFSMPRVAIAVRAGDEVLGSIWAAVSGPLSEERAQALQDAAKLVALHLLRVRAGADVERRLRADLLGSALEGGSGAREALDRLGLTGQPLMVFGVAMSAADGAEPVDGATLARERQRLSDAFALHLSAVHPRSAAALVGDVTYGLVPVIGQATEGEERAQRIARDFLDRVGDRSRPVLGIGPVASDLTGLAHSRASVDRILRVLRDGRGERRAARLDDIQVESLMLEVRDLAVARGDRPTGSLARLIAYDRRHQSALVETLEAWLDAFGDVTAAAEALYVHPNTFRYRLRRVAEVGELNLADPEQRFVAMLQLRVLGRPESP